MRVGTGRPDWCQNFPPCLLGPAGLGWVELRTRRLAVPVRVLARIDGVRVGRDGALGAGSFAGGIRGGDSAACAVRRREVPARRAAGGAILHPEVRSRGCGRLALGRLDLRAQLGDSALEGLLAVLAAVPDEHEREERRQVEGESRADCRQEPGDGHPGEHPAEDLEGDHVAQETDPEYEPDEFVVAETLAQGQQDLVGRSGLREHVEDQATEHRADHQDDGAGHHEDDREEVLGEGDDEDRDGTSVERDPGDDGKHERDDDGGDCDRQRSREETLHGDLLQRILELERFHGVSFL